MHPIFLTVAPFAALALVLLMSFKRQTLLPRAVLIRARQKQPKRH
jgi:hypothetical protein